MRLERPMENEISPPLAGGAESTKDLKSATAGPTTPVSPVVDPDAARAFARVPQDLDQAPHVVVSAVGDWHPQVPPGMVGVTAARGGRVGNTFGPDMRYFLVPKDEYGLDGHGTFVIDPNRHKEIPEIDYSAGLQGSREAGERYLAAKAKGFERPEEIHASLANDAGELADRTRNPADRAEAVRLHEHARHVFSLVLSGLEKWGEDPRRAEAARVGFSHHTMERDRHMRGGENAQPFRDSLKDALLADPSAIERLPYDIRSRLNPGEGHLDLSVVETLDDRDLYRMSREITLPREVLAHLDAVIEQHPNLPYEASVNLWAKGKKDWTLIAMQVDPDFGAELAEKIKEFGFNLTHVQAPYTPPPYSLEQ